MSRLCTDNGQRTECEDSARILETEFAIHLGYRYRSIYLHQLTWSGNPLVNQFDNVFQMCFKLERLLGIIDLEVEVEVLKQSFARPHLGRIGWDGKLSGER